MKKDRYIDEKRQIYRQKKTDIQLWKPMSVFLIC